MTTDKIDAMTGEPIPFYKTIKMVSAHRERSEDCVPERSEECLILQAKRGLLSSLLLRERSESSIFPECSEDYCLCECRERYLLLEHSEH